MAAISGEVKRLTTASSPSGIRKNNRKNRLRGAASHASRLARRRDGWRAATSTVPAIAIGGPPG
jgi:hypothetical protein